MVENDAGTRVTRAVLRSELPKPLGRALLLAGRR